MNFLQQGLMSNPGKEAMRVSPELLSHVETIMSTDSEKLLGRVVTGEG